MRRRSGLRRRKSALKEGRREVRVDPQELLFIETQFKAT